MLRYTKTDVLIESARYMIFNYLTAMTSPQLNIQQTQAVFLFFETINIVGHWLWKRNVVKAMYCFCDEIMAHTVNR